ncbi:MAG TPA: FMN-binding protein [Candidatus Diapherotrites archaeon]|nr:FMN-binding protein [Candidatus Diapherotrites archaeon]
MRRKGKFRMMIIIPAALVTIVGLVLGGGILFTAGERREAKNLPIAVIDFKKVNDGTYIGEYEGGMYKWRANKVQVTVSSGSVTDIKTLGDKKAGCGEKPELTGELFNRVIEAQSLQVDAVSGATLTSKAYLKSVENALTQAQKK